MKRQNVVIIFTVFIFSSCLWQSSTFIVTENYQNKKFFGKSVTINLPKSELVFPDRQEINDTFGEGEVDSAYLSFFDAGFPKALKSLTTFDGIQISHDERPTDQQWEGKEFYISKDKNVFLIVPQDGQLFQDTSDFIIFIERMKVYSFGQWELFNGRYRSQAAKYFIWDNRNGKIVYYGIYDKAESIKGPWISSKQQWSHSLGKMAQAMFTHSPFYKP